MNSEGGENTPPTIERREVLGTTRETSRVLAGSLGIDTNLLHPDSTIPVAGAELFVAAFKAKDGDMLMTDRLAAYTLRNREVNTTNNFDADYQAWTNWVEDFRRDNADNEEVKRAIKSLKLDVYDETEFANNLYDTYLDTTTGDGIDAQQKLDLFIQGITEDVPTVVALETRIQAIDPLLDSFGPDARDRVAGRPAVVRSFPR